MAKAARATPKQTPEAAPASPLLSHDELIRFGKEARAAYDNFSDFSWKDGIGRSWVIRPDVINNHSHVTIQAHKGDQARADNLSTRDFSDEKAMAAILKIDAELR